MIFMAGHLVAISGPHIPERVSIEQPEANTCCLAAAESLNRLAAAPAMMLETWIQNAFKKYLLV